MRLGVRDDGKGVLCTERGEKSVICPECGSENTYIKETRGNDTSVTNRRRLCADCRFSFWTFETVYPDFKKPKPKKPEFEY